MGGLAAAGALLGGVGALVDGGPGARMRQLTVLLFTACAACCLDDPAGEIADVCPVSRFRQTVTRAVTLFLPALAAVAVAATVRSWELLVEGALGILCGFSASVAVRRRRHEPSDVVALVAGAALLMTLFV